MRVIVTGGGTGGHIYPAMAIAKGLLERTSEMEVLYVGTREGMESRLVPENGLAFKGIAGKGLPRKLSLEIVSAVLSNVTALWETKKILKEFRPDLVIGTGGYVSGPVVMTAAFFGIPTLLHEQNALPGKTNQFLSRRVNQVILTFPESQKYFAQKDKIRVIGLPVRDEIGMIDRRSGAAAYGLNPMKKTLLITGGSRGALTINQAMTDILTKLKDNTEIQIIWGIGSATYLDIISELEKRNIRWQRDEWRILEYIHHMPDAYACADLCICRAGATTLAELSAAGKACILIPYPYAAENHQEFNARAFEDQGAARVILDKELSAERLWDEIQKVIINPFRLEEMGQNARKVFEPDALKKIIDLCLQTAWR